jgi:glycerophosphoryl diester phosphodiesterase
VIIFGHRGAPGYPPYGENTIPSFMKALNCGATGLEFDVRRCRDGQMVVIHDDTIDRTTDGKGSVADFSYDELRKFNAGFGQPIPLLTDVLDQFGTRCILNIELKDTGLGPDLKKLLLTRRLERHVIVSAFDWDELRILPPEVPTALITSKLENLLTAARDCRASAIHPQKNIVTPSLLETARAANLRVNVWTINDVDEIARFRALGVDGIFTDFPERCTKIPRGR